MGGIEIIVPEGIPVEMSGVAIMGGKDCRVKDVTPLPGTPLVRVHAFAFWGGVTVRTKPRAAPRAATAPATGPNAGSCRVSATSRLRETPRDAGAGACGRADAPMVEEVAGRLQPGHEAQASGCARRHRHHPLQRHRGLHRHHRAPRRPAAPRTCSTSHNDIVRRAGRLVRRSRGEVAGRQLHARLRRRPPRPPTARSTCSARSAVGPTRSPTCRCGCAWACTPARRSARPTTSSAARSSSRRASPAEAGGGQILVSSLLKELTDELGRVLLQPAAAR